jgi:hypothetical protein
MISDDFSRVTILNRGGLPRPLSLDPFPKATSTILNTSDFILDDFKINLLNQPLKFKVKGEKNENKG